MTERPSLCPNLLVCFSVYVSVSIRPSVRPSSDSRTRMSGRTQVILYKDEILFLQGKMRVEINTKIGANKPTATRERMNTQGEARRDVRMNAKERPKTRGGKDERGRGSKESGGGGGGGLNGG